ncbi:MAG TPA: DUF5652 family protein [Candidatus Saccharimonadales bacterium]|nr:DUF5652 family protein [Candidatus Saccharimonadales bacterium]
MVNINISNSALTWLIVLAIWDLFWRGLALWRAVKRGDKPWFVVMLIINSVGILPILYLLFTEPKTKKKN